MFGFNLFGGSNTFAGKTTNNTSTLSMPVLRAKQTGAWLGTNTSPTIDLTTGWTIGSGYVLQPNDIVIVTYVVSEHNNRTFDIGVATSGYIEVASTVSPDATFETFISVSYKRMSGTPDTQVVLSGLGLSDTNVGQTAVVEVWSSVDTTTAMDVTPMVASGTDVFVQIPAIYADSNEAVVVECGGYSGTTGSFPFAGVEALDFLQTTMATYAKSYIGTGWKRASGMYRPGNTWTSSQPNANHTWAAVAIVLRPASYTPPPSITRRLLARASSWLS